MELLRKNRFVFTKYLSAKKTTCANNCLKSDDKLIFLLHKKDFGFHDNAPRSKQQIVHFSAINISFTLTGLTSRFIMCLKYIY